jgi:hypothetical protein
LLAGRFVFDANESMELRNGQLRMEASDLTH